MFCSDMNSEQARFVPRADSASVRRSTCRLGIASPIMRSVARTQLQSSPVTKVQAVPSHSERPVRPMRWVYASGVFGTS